MLNGPFTRLEDVGLERWNSLAPRTNPFLNHAFMAALEQSQSIGHSSGWDPVFFLQAENKGMLYSFIKQHSYGEYIFDWEWARAFQQYGLSYYPKLTSMIPFTPANTSHFLMPQFDPAIAEELLTEYEAFYQAYDFSSSHFLFLSNAEKEFFKSQGYLMRESLQYHFFNEAYSSFDHYLDCLKTKKAKQMRKERCFPDLEIERFTGAQLTEAHAHQMFDFYSSTITDKHAIGYLNKAFFELIFRSLKENILYLQASKGGQAVAGALFFYDEATLYGRYWGSRQAHENLHFELCYYQGIDFCIEKKLTLFEAGAQGEHKISRGFRPVRIHSAHKIKNKAFSEAIGNFIKEEKLYLNGMIEELSQRLPFKVL